VLLALVLALLPARHAWADTWQQRLRLALEERVAEGQTRPGPGDTEWDPWYRIGPFAATDDLGFDTAFPPMQDEIDVTARCGGMAWTPAPQYLDGVVHHLQAGALSATFLTRAVRSPVDQTVRAYFGSDDGMKAWLNNRLIISHDVPRGPAPNQEIVDLKLRRGTNRLTIMPFNNSGGHGFYFSTAPQPGSLHEREAEAVWQRVLDEYRDAKSQRQIQWERDDRIWDAPWPRGDLNTLALHYASATRVEPFRATAAALGTDCRDEPALDALRQVYYRSRMTEDVSEVRAALGFTALRRALEHLCSRYGDDAPRAAEFTDRVDRFEARANRVLDAAIEEHDPEALEAALELVAEWRDLQREVLLAGPALDFERVLYVERRGAEGLPANWQGNDPLHGQSFDNRIATFDLRAPNHEATVYRPERPVFVGDVDLHWDAERLLFSTDGTVCEVRVDGSGFRSVITEIDSYDPCYLPDGRVLFVSNAGHHAVPCVGGSDYVGNLHLARADGTGIRRLCFDQDNNWHPSVLENGRVLYTRWEYTDSAHYFARLLMHMNPDGTGQMEFYGSNSYWPNSLFYARQIPGSPTQFVAVVSGHHGVARAGELVLFDAARGRHEANGAIQKIPGFGKPVLPTIRDDLIGPVWPRFLHPWPLDDTTFLVACKESPRHAWGIYLADVFGNLVPLKAVDDRNCLEPIPLRRRSTPARVPDRVQPDRRTATVFLQNVYAGEGLRGVPAGTVTSLRIFQYEYSYRHVGGHNVIGYEGPWDVRRLLGTVPVFKDGSAVFTIPANVPLSLQPLDSEGRALAVMRSWFVGMPGENVSCVGCHEKQNSVAGVQKTLAANKAPVDIEPWLGPTRGFSFQREVQPVLDRRCVGCHNGTEPGRPLLADKGERLGFPTAQNAYSRPYLELAAYVRRNGPEGDYHVLTPLEFHASTSELVQLLRKGHHGVELNAEEWDRIVTWIDLNVPFFGTWTEACPQISAEQVRLRRENRRRYAGVDEDIEAVKDPYTGDRVFVPPGKAAVEAGNHPPDVAGWPFDTAEARIRQGTDTRILSLPLDNGVELRLVRIPAGRFAMGDHQGFRDESPVTAVTVEAPFWMLETEVTNAQFACFDPGHDSGVYDMRWKDQVNRGYYVNQPDKPVVRVSWNRAMAFCDWLSEQTGRRFSLPTEAEWEWACRAGTATPLAWGDVTTDFAPHANLADATTRKLVVTGVDPQPEPDPHPLASYLPAIMDVDDGVLHLAAPASYRPNAWGLYDMHGNVAEWTGSQYRPYPYRPDDGREEQNHTSAERVVRGGSWHDRPRRARSAFRLSYRPWQRVFDVGFRVVSPLTAPEATDKPHPAKAPPQAKPDPAQTNTHPPVNPTARRGCSLWAVGCRVGR
jgi:formylglycine-generating enzyme required for sulfatase activity